MQNKFILYKSDNQCNMDGKKIFIITSEGDSLVILSDDPSPKCAQSGQYISIKRHRSWCYCTLTVQTEVEGHTEQKEWYDCRWNIKTGSGEIKWRTVARWRVRSETPESAQQNETPYSRREEEEEFASLFTTSGIHPTAATRC